MKLFKAKIIFTVMVLVVIFLTTVVLIVFLSRQDYALTEKDASIQNNQNILSEQNLFVSSERNFDNIQFADFRKEFDQRFNELADELSDCYYNYWKQGQSKPFQGYDKKATVAESKILFDTLQALIWYWYDVEFDRQNKLQPLEQQISEEQYDYIYKDDGILDYKKSVKAQSQIDELAKTGISLIIYVTSSN